ncbi:hypothetical protein RQP46_006180 [Phenoliferia psychrophenolica]
MATFSSLPTELLTHICRLSTEDESPREQQRFRFSFGLISRASYVATANATTFVVRGEKQANALANKLEREKVPVVRDSEEERATTSTRRVSSVHRLSCTFRSNASNHILDGLLARLLRATPNLIAFELDMGERTAASLATAFPQLEVALGEPLALKELHLHGTLKTTAIVRMLMPLQALVKLDMGDVWLSPDEDPEVGLAAQLALPHLRELRITTPSESSPFRRVNPPVLLAALVKGATAGLRTLDLSESANRAVTPFLDTLTPFLSSLDKFIWIHQLVDVNNRANMLAFIGSMISVKIMYISMWIGNGAPLTNHEPIDPAIFDRLATLPSLHTLQLVVWVGVLDDKPFLSFLSNAPPMLRCIKLLVDICHLENKDETSEEQQLLRYSFDLVTRVCFLATTNAMNFLAKGRNQATAIKSNIEWEMERFTPRRVVHATTAVEFHYKR